MRTHNIPFYYKKNRKYSPFMPPDMALSLTLISSNYPCLEHIFMVRKVFEPLNFYCNSGPISLIATKHIHVMCMACSTSRTATIASTCVVTGTWP